jgi:hypothetical protein
MATNKVLIQSVQLQELLLAKDSCQACRPDKVDDPYVGRLCYLFPVIFPQ